MIWPPSPTAPYRQNTFMTQNEPYQQLRMVWPHELLDHPPVVKMPPEYHLRTYRTGDEDRFYKVMELSGWPGWAEEKLAPWRLRILPEGWFMVVHTGTGLIVAVAMALRDTGEFGRPGGELGWLASDPSHAGRGLGLAVSAAVTTRLLQEGFQDVHLYTEHYRLPALKTYLKLGYIPYLYLPEMAGRWQLVCQQLGWQFTPEKWKR